MGALRIVINPKTNSPGSYTTSSVEARPWAVTNIAASQPKTRRAKQEAVIVNPVFKVCTELVDDPTWKAIFQDAATGKLPKGFSYKNGFITHKHRNKVSRIEIDTDNPHEALLETMHFFQEKAGIMSKEDRLRAKQDFEDYLTTHSSAIPTTWSKVTPRLKSILISTFVTRIVNRLALNSKEKAELKNTIHLGFLLGCFTNNHVILENGYITEIYGLEVKEEVEAGTSMEDRIFINYEEAPRQIKKSKSSEGPKEPKISFYKLWVKLLGTLEKKTGHKVKFSSIDDSST